MLNGNFLLSPGHSNNTATVHWTTPEADWVSYINVNGQSSIANFDPGTAEREIDIPVNFLN